MTTYGESARRGRKSHEVPRRQLRLSEVQAENVRLRNPVGKRGAPRHGSQNYFSSRDDVIARLPRRRLPLFHSAAEMLHAVLRPA